MVKARRSGRHKKRPEFPLTFKEIEERLRDIDDHLGNRHYGMAAIRGAYSVYGLKLILMRAAKEFRRRR